MLIEYYDSDSYFYDMIEFYCEKAAYTLVHKSLISLIIQGVLLAFSIWDKNSRFFVILTAIGIYSVHGSLSVRISLRRMEQAAKKLYETKCRQFTRSIDTRREKSAVHEEIFIPVKEQGFENHIRAGLVLPVLHTGQILQIV